VQNCSHLDLAVFEGWLIDVTCMPLYWVAPHPATLIDIHIQIDRQMEVPIGATVI